MSDILDIARWIIALALFLLWLGIAILNWGIAWNQWRHPDIKHPSIITFVAALLAWVILALIPIGHFHDRKHWAWVPWLLEYGSLPCIAVGVLHWIHEFWIKRRLFPVMTLQGSNANGIQCRLTLYRNGDCLLKKTNMPPPVMELSLTGKWRHETPTTLIVVFGSDEVRLEETDTAGRYQPSTASDSRLFEGVEFQVK